MLGEGVDLEIESRAQSGCSLGGREMGREGSHTVWPFSSNTAVVFCDHSALTEHLKLTLNMGGFLKERFVPLRKHWPILSYPPISIYGTHLWQSFIFLERLFHSM